MLETGRALFFGDNLDILRNRIPDAFVDLVYLDPPFNSQQDYNVLFKERDGTPAPAQITAFLDTWRWDEVSARCYAELVEEGGSVSLAMQAFHRLIGNSDMLAYLAMMAPRLIELHRVLKPTGSLFLHCDPTASHYLKLLLDSVFGPANCRNEIIWRRTSAHGNAKKKFAAIHDTLLFYSKSQNYTWNQQFEPYSQEYIETHFVHEDPDGRRFRRTDLRNPGYRPNLKYDYTASNGITYQPHPNGWAVSREKMEQLDREGKLFFPKKENGRLRRKLYLEESPGVPVSDTWTDIKPIFATAQERIGYPTQKPLTLLKRIIASTTNEGDLVLDPFCGCGTTIEAAEELDRGWVGIDITRLAIKEITQRLRQRFRGISWEVDGEPKALEEAVALAQIDPHHFQWWVLTRLGAGEQHKKKGPDKGIDGRLFFHEREGGETKQILFSVKSGLVRRRDVHELRGVVEREHAQIGVLVTLQTPTRAMREEAACAGFYDSLWGRHPRIQIITVEEIFDGRGIDCPPPAQVRVERRRRPKRRADEDIEQTFLPLLYTIPSASPPVAQSEEEGVRGRRTRRSAGRR